MNDLHQALLPGIAEPVTLFHIVPKLSWTAFHVLASVSRTWQQAIQSRKVYGERIWSKATETLVVVKRRDDDDKLVASLYSLREKRFYWLPPIPSGFGRISRYSQFLTSNGTLYVIKAGCNCNCPSCKNLPTAPPTSYYQPCRSFYDAKQAIMLDLAGQGQWEAYDIKQAISRREQSQGLTYDIMCGAIVHDHSVVKKWLMCSVKWCMSRYNLVEHPWRTVRTAAQQSALEEHHDRSRAEDGTDYVVRFVGNSLYFSPRTRHVLAMSSEIEPAMRTISSNPIKVDLKYILPVNDEFIALAEWTDKRHNQGSFMIQSAGFGSASTEIVWERIPDSTSFLDRQITYAMCPIQL